MSAHVYDIYLAVIVELTNIVYVVDEMLCATSDTHVFTYLLGGGVVHSKNETIMMLI